MYSLGELPLPIRWIIKPWRMAVVILALIFVLEAALMFVLPAIFGDRLGKSGMAAADAFVLTVMLAPCIWGLLVRPLKRIAETRKQLLDWAMSTEERKAGEMSRDLHDNLGQLVTSMTVGLRTIEEISKDPVVVEHARRIRGTGLELHNAIRSLARGLRPRVLDDLGLAAALANLATDWRESSKIQFVLDIDALKNRRFSTEVETAMYRIAQEAVTNAVRHGNPQSIRIRAQFVESRLFLSIEDDGCGFSANGAQSEQVDRRPFGLISMRERAESIGGTFSLHSSIGRGVSVQVKLDTADLSTKIHDTKVNAMKSIAAKVSAL